MEGAEAWPARAVLARSDNGSGGSTGPDLSQEGARGRSRAWLITQITNPKAHDPQTVRPPCSSLSQQQLDELVAYLQHLGTAAPTGTGSGGGHG